MKAAIVALVVIGGLFVGYSGHATVTVDGQTVDCKASGYASVDDADPTAPDVHAPAPACTGLG